MEKGTDNPLDGSSINLTDPFLERCKAKKRSDYWKYPTVEASELGVLYNIIVDCSFTDRRFRGQI